MATVFISHVEEDRTLALEIARGLERAGYSTWYYERDSSPGLSYLLQVNRAIEACQFVVLLISPRSLDSNQVTAEVVRAHETGKSFVPVRAGISHEDFQRRRPEWNMAVGAAGSIAVPDDGASAILPEIIDGLGLLSTERAGRVSSSVSHEAAPAGRPAGTARERIRHFAAAGAIAIALVLVALYGFLGGSFGGRLISPGANAPSERAAEPPPATTPAPASGATPGAVPPADSAIATGADNAPAPPATLSPATATGRRATPPRVPECDESNALRRVHERGRLEARDDLNDTTYAFVICESQDTANGTVSMQIRSSTVTGTRWSDEAATRKAEDMESRGVECEPTGTPAVRSSGKNIQRSVVYVLCQASGQPTSIEVHATTLKADASPHPTQVLRAAWPSRPQ